MNRFCISLIVPLAIASTVAVADTGRLADTEGSKADSKASGGSKAGALVELALKGFGGAESVMGTSSLVAHGHADNPATGKPGTYSHYITRRGDFRLDLIFGPKSVSRSRSGLVSYASVDGGRLERVEDEDDWRIFFELKSLGLIFGLLSQEYRPEYSGMGFIGGKRYEKLALYDPAGPALLVVLDGKTGYVKRTFMDTGEGDKGTFEMRFSDYRAEGDLVLPHSFSQYVGGRRVLSVKIRDFEFNTELSPRLFKP
jgi:hypothetical protein